MVQNIRCALSFIPAYFLFNNFYANFNCGHWSIWDFLIWIIFLLSPIWIHVEDIFQHVYNFKSSKGVGSFLKKLTWKSVVLNGIHLGPHKGIPRKNFNERNNWEELHNVQFSLKYSRLVESSTLGNYSIILSHHKYFHIFFKSFFSFSILYQTNWISRIILVKMIGLEQRETFEADMDEQPILVTTFKQIFTQILIPQPSFIQFFNLASMFVTDTGMLCRNQDTFSAYITLLDEHFFAVYSKKWRNGRFQKIMSSRRIVIIMFLLHNNYLSWKKYIWYTVHLLHIWIFATARNISWWNLA